MGQWRRRWDQAVRMGGASQMGPALLRGPLAGAEHKDTKTSQGGGGGYSRARRDRNKRKRKQWCSLRGLGLGLGRCIGKIQLG